MSMRSYVEGFTSQLREAIELGKSFKLDNNKTFSNILICGLGGSGIGGGIARDLVAGECTVPIDLTNDYNIPAYVNENTLCIASSYSGNTEETLEAVSKAMAKGASVACVTSGGKLQELAEANNFPHIIVPGGMPPRAALGYSLTQQLFLLRAYGFISDDILNDLSGVADFLSDSETQIKQISNTIAKQIYDKIPVLYIIDGLESIVIRWRQQLNENSKMLLWHNKIPEMNHNELVGWAEEHKNITPIFFATDYDHPRSTYRAQLNEEVIRKYSAEPVNVKAQGANRVQQAFYLINLGDWLSIDLADIRNVDAMNIDVINNLKSKLAEK